MELINNISEYEIPTYVFTHSSTEKKIRTENTHRKTEQLCIVYLVPSSPQTEVKSRNPSSHLFYYSILITETKRQQFVLS